MSDGQFWIANSIDTLENLHAHIDEEWAKHHYLIVRVEQGGNRSGLQNNALHLYCHRLANALNEAGYDMRVVLEKISKTGEIPWTQESVKERLWRPVQLAMTGQASSTKPKRAEYPEIYEALNRVMASNFGVHVAWPVRENEK